MAGYVKSYDPDFSNGGPVTGKVVATSDPNEALEFDGVQEAMEFYRQQSKTVPLRPDGKPNRPLTAYTVEFENVSVCL